MNNKKTNVILILLSIFIFACGGGSPDSSPPPGAPQNVITSNANGQVSVSWQAVGGATEYRIYWSTTAGVSKEKGMVIPKASTPYTHTGLTNETTYYYVVTAVNRYGESAESSEVSATPSFFTPPLPPESIAAQASNRTINIAWTASQTDLSNKIEATATSYNIYWSITSGVSKTNGIMIPNVSSPYVHTNLINDATYYYIVTGVNQYGEGNASQEVSATPNRGNIPFPPTGLTATAGNFQSTVNWDAVTGAISYNLYWSTSYNVSSQNGTKIENVTSPYIHSGLEEGTTYYYVVTSVNGYGESEDSTVASVIIVDNRRDIFVAMGDSITAGYALNSYDDCYVARLSRMWGKTAVNEGVDGTRSSYGTSLIRPILEQYNPRYLTIYYGTNDVGFYENNQIVSNLRYMIVTAKENGTIPVVATIGPFFGQWAWRNASATELNKKIRQMAAEEGVACADLEAALNWNSSYIFPDGIHPNGSGHQIIANTFYQALTQ